METLRVPATHKHRQHLQAVRGLPYPNRRGGQAEVSSPLLRFLAKLESSASLRRLQEKEKLRLGIKRFQEA